MEAPKLKRGRQFLPPDEKVTTTYVYFSNKQKSAIIKAVKKLPVTENKVTDFTSAIKRMAEQLSISI